MKTMIGLAAALMAGGVGCVSADLPARTPPEMRVMTFNVRYGTAKDGENHWDKRKDFLVETIRAFDPDVLGTQETLDFQRDYLAKGLPTHEAFGVGRDDGAAGGEMMAVFYRRARFEKIDGGHFWLSETPERVGSKSWDSSLPRMVTWVKLRDRRAPEAPPVLFANTHFDHVGARARLESARLLRARLATLGQGCRVVVTGDFNAGEGSEPYKALFGAVEGRESAVLDAFRVANPARADNEGTTTGFRADAKGRARIDWIGVSRDWKIGEVRIDRTARDGRTPSDHFPVTAVLRAE